jgi:hypothetical protein
LLINRKGMLKRLLREPGRQGNFFRVNGARKLDVSAIGKRKGLQGRLFLRQSFKRNLFCCAVNTEIGRVFQ